MLPTNAVYRCIEDTAHGAASWQKQDVALCGAVALLVGLVGRHPVYAGIAAVVALIGVSLGRRAWEERRDYLLLFVRRLERRRVYRRLDPDRSYRPYGEELT
jgi:hypothetical protein